MRKKDLDIVGKETKKDVSEGKIEDVESGKQTKVLPAPEQTLPVQDIDKLANVEEIELEGLQCKVLPPEENETTDSKTQDKIDADEAEAEI